MKGSTLVVNSTTTQCLFALLLVLEAGVVNAFTKHGHQFVLVTPTTSKTARARGVFRTSANDQPETFQLTRLFQSSANDYARGDAPKRRRKRVKRKEVVPTSEVQERESEEETTPVPPVVPELKPREDGPVQLQVQDVRDLVGVGSTKSAAAAAAQQADTFIAASAKTTTSNQSFPSSLSPSPPELMSPDSLQVLLQDAKELQALEKGDDKYSVAATTDEGEFSILDTLRNILSTIVTIDFFVVCAFLLWFLAGIFCTYILKDDTVQIAFNQLFQPVVQPALGILMIGAIAGSFGEKEDEEAA